MAEVEAARAPGEGGTSTEGAKARVLTWNINGLRKVAADHGGLKELLDQFMADIVCFQEIKITRAGLVEHDLARAQGYHGFFNHCQVRRKQSYSGVATFVRSDSGLRTLAATTSLSDARFFGAPGSSAEGLSADRLVEINAEGRVVVTDHGHFVLFNVYAPCVSSGDEDEKTDERRQFKRDFLAMLKSRVFQAREGGRGVILVGDLNACASQLDHGYTITDSDFFASQWSKWIRGLLGLDLSDPSRVVDCFRRLHPDRKDAFTCWNTQTGARENNYGTRIDYIIADTAFADLCLRACDIMPDFLGSDHCPVRAEFLMPLVQITPGETNTTGYGVDEPRGGAGAVEDALGWPEHPPECSCFYLELTGKQEKLAKYFAADSSQQRATPGNRQDCLKRGCTTTNGAGNSGLNTMFGVASDQNFSERPRSGVPLLGTRAGKEFFGKRGVTARCRGAGVGGLGRGVSSGSSGKGRGVGAGGGERQSKLAFASNGKVGLTTLSIRASRVSTPGFSVATPREKAASKASDRRTDEDEAAQNTQAESDRGRSPVIENISQPGKTFSANSEQTCDSNEQRPKYGRSDSLCSSASFASASGSSAGGGGGSPENGDGSAEAWKALFGQKRGTPPCEHDEPSIQRTVIKQGVNHNRRFYTCARSAGNWPTDRNARCNFFQWRLDGVRGYKDRPPRGDSMNKKQRRE